ncbi:hypothetical protein [Chitinophaga skermanii]|uniref:hypothetical protein n=1 Tax=Chitinophaga skermanii TaxID=331697 RepID=UPI0011E5C94D|nr:hypothetical protein [Chitinophaga skermanii]
MHICILLLLGDGYVIAGARKDNTRIRYDRARHHIIDHSSTTLIKDLNIDKEGDHLITDDVFDEDPHSSFARKYKLLVSYSAINSYQSILTFLYSSHHAPPGCYDLSSYIYIKHSALRI